MVAGTVRPHVRRVRELDRHALDCVFHRHYTRINRGVDKWTEEILEGDAMDGAVLTGFHELTRALFSRAYSASWVTASGNPPVTAVMGQVETLVRERAFLAAGQSLARAARTRGLKVLFGLVPCLPLFAWSPPAVSSELLRRQGRLGIRQTNSGALFFCGHAGHPRMAPDSFQHIAGGLCRWADSSS